MKKLLMFLCAMLFVFGAVGMASADTIGNDIIDRFYLDGADDIAFIDPTLEFSSAGTLTSWSVWLTGNSGDEMKTQIYRYTGMASDWELVHQLGVTLTTDGAKTFLDPGFNVQAGDVVGWWFGADMGIIPYDLIGTDDVEWTNWRASGITNPTVGTVYSFDTGSWYASSQRREYSISVDYTPDAVPEPSTILLLGCSLFGFAALKRKLQNFTIS